MNPIRLWQVLTQDEGASTFKRLLTSRHVADLQLIFWSSCLLMVVGSIFVFVWHGWVDTTGVIGSATLISLIVGTGCGVLAWCYLTGSARLGVVDLFACEITTICMVTAVVETAPHLTRMHDDPPSQAVKFSSEEEYAPVFSNNPKDLEVLEARVVEPVTAFYTYLKVMRDYLRQLSVIERPSDNVKCWQQVVRNVIYMLFLMLESARLSVDNLIEFVPEQAESEIAILMSELVAYCFLLNYYEHHSDGGYDARLERLRLRQRYYPEIVRDLYIRTIEHRDAPGRDKKKWEQAAALLNELNQRYREAFGENIAINSMLGTSKVPASVVQSSNPPWGSDATMRCGRSSGKNG
jgi:hypothetical protein